jgi:hypothetical protein
MLSAIVLELVIVLELLIVLELVSVSSVVVVVVTIVEDEGRRQETISAPVKVMPNRLEGKRKFRVLC